MLVLGQVRDDAAIQELKQAHGEKAYAFDQNIVNTDGVFRLNELEQTQKLSNMVNADLADIAVKPLIQDQLDRRSARRKPFNVYIGSDW